MMPLALSNSMISEMIRKKKKKMMTSEPDIVDTSPDMNAQDVYDMEQAGRIEDTLMSPKKIDADLTDIDAEESYDGVGLSPEEKKRMDRLRSYFDSQMSWSNSKMGMMK